MPRALKREKWLRDSACDPESAIWVHANLIFNRKLAVRKFAADEIHDAMERIVRRYQGFDRSGRPAGGTAFRQHVTH